LHHLVSGLIDRKIPCSARSIKLWSQQRCAATVDTFSEEARVNVSESNEVNREEANVIVQTSFMSS
jgi:hypothetical protein